MSLVARLKARPSYARVLEEARPYMHLFPSPRNAHTAQESP